MAVIDVHNLTSRRLWCSSYCLACAGSGDGRNNVRSYGMPAGPAARGTNPLNKNLGDKVPRSPAAAPRSSLDANLTAHTRAQVGGAPKV